MSTIKSDILISPQDIMSASSTQGTDLGAKVTTGDGRYFRYIKNGGTAIIPGYFYQAPVEDTTNLNPSGGLAVVAAGTSAIAITTTTSVTVAEGVTNGGYVTVYSGPGAGYIYKIKSNAAVSAGSLTINLEDPIQVALTTSSKIAIQPSPYSGVLVAPVTLTSSVVGASVFPIPANQYGWIQTRGAASIIFSGVGTVGFPITSVTTGTAGWAAIATASGTTTTYQNPLGNCLGTARDGLFSLINLSMD